MPAAKAKAATKGDKGGPSPKYRAAPAQTAKEKPEANPSAKQATRLPASIEPPVTSEEAEATAPRPERIVEDFISGRQVRATPEEIESVQVFSRRLVEELGYPTELIQTRPQFRVRPRPSEARSRGYPVDIAVFSSSKKLEDDAYILVECKKKTRKDGEEQLKLYLTMSSAQIGVWFNGKDHLYLLKEYREGGTIHWSVLPTLPKCGQSVGEIGQLTRKDLILPTNLKAVFRDIRNHLAGNTTGITRDQQLAVEITAILFCKIYDELNCDPDDIPQFRASHKELASPDYARR